MGFRTQHFRSCSCCNQAALPPIAVAEVVENSSGRRSSRIESGCRSRNQKVLCFCEEIAAIAVLATLVRSSRCGSSTAAASPAVGEAGVAGVRRGEVEVITPATSHQCE